LTLECPLGAAGNSPDHNPCFQLTEFLRPPTFACGSRRQIRGPGTRTLDCTRWVRIVLELCGGAGGLVVLAGFKPVAGLREAAWVGSIPTRLRQRDSPASPGECAESREFGEFRGSLARYSSCFERRLYDLNSSDFARFEAVSNCNLTPGHLWPRRVSHACRWIR